MFVLNSALIFRCVSVLVSDSGVKLSQEGGNLLTAEQERIIGEDFSDRNKYELAS